MRERRLPRRDRRRAGVRRTEQGHDQAPDRRRKRSPTRSTEILELGDEGKTYTAEGPLAKPASESGAAADTATRRGRAGTALPRPALPAPRSSRPRTAPGRRSSCSRAAGRTGASSGRSSRSSSCRSSTTTGKITSYDYIDARGCRRTPCAAGQRARLRQGLLARRRRPGHRVRLGPVPDGTPDRLRRATEPFYGRPLVAWLPAPGADTLRDRVVALTLSVARRQAHRRRRGHRNDAAAQARHLVVPRSAASTALCRRALSS